MLYRLFAKEAFEPIEEALEYIYQKLGIQDEKLKVRKQIATYSKAYSYVIEGVLKRHRFVLSLHRSPLKERTIKEQLELIIQCENPNWVTLVLAKGARGHQQKLGIEKIDRLKEEGLTEINLKSNQKDLVEQIFDDSICQQVQILEQINFSTFRLDKKRLYVQLSWLPDNLDKRDALLKIIELGINLVQKIDQH